MKSTNTRVHGQRGKKTRNTQERLDRMRNGRLPARNVVKPFRGDPEAQLAVLAAALKLTAEQSRLLDLLSEYEGLTPRDFCLYGLIGYWEASFGDLQAFAMGCDGGRPREQAWAAQFYPKVKGSFSKFGNLQPRCGVDAVSDSKLALLVPDCIERATTEMERERLAEKGGAR